MYRSFIARQYSAVKWLIIEINVVVLMLSSVYLNRNNTTNYHGYFLVTQKDVVDSLPSKRLLGKLSIGYCYDWDPPQRYPSFSCLK